MSEPEQRMYVRVAKYSLLPKLDSGVTCVHMRRSLTG